MNMEIKPYEGIDKLLFGMSFLEIRENIDFEIKSFKKVASTATFTDKILGKGIHIHYDDEDKCEAIEFGTPSNPTYQGIHFIGIPFVEVKNKIMLFDENLDNDDTGFISYQLGIGVYVSSLKDSIYVPIEGVIIFKRGYYD